MNKLKKFIKEQIGPGLITGASDDDPSGIVTYSIAGAKNGLDFIWTPLFTLPLMYYVQESCARIALITRRGLIFLIKNLYGFKLAFLISVLMFFANTFNLAADINAVAMILNYIFPYLPMWIYSLLVSLLMILIVIILPYKKFANLMKFLVIFLFCYLFLIFVIKINWLEVFQKIILPEIKFTKDWWLILIAILGTTISPYLFFWQEEEELEEIKREQKIDIKKSLFSIKVDTFLGMFISNLIMFAIILSTGVVLHPLGIYDIQTIDDLVRVLEPLFGKYAFLFFSLGIIGSGLIAIPVLAGGAAYILAELFNLPATLDKKFKEAIPFYVIVIFSIFLSNIFNFIGLSPIQLLFYTAVIYGFLAPILIFIIFKLGNRKDLMGDYVNNKNNNFGLLLTFFFMILSVILFFVL
ncbi:MAG: divalent metal cation transporter [Patescibacteria group bacterium]|nr:divalent metal cation transporter [Patescibacteria group bacterium]